jgi:SAM-dependent methyltransferase
VAVAAGVPDHLQAVGVGRRDADAASTVRANRSWWDTDADAYHTEHGDFLGVADFVWCPENLREDDARLLGDVSGLDVLEVGCGAAMCSRWVAQRGARAIAFDLSAGMLRHARDGAVRTGIDVPLVQADAQYLPFRDASFDITFTAFGAVGFVADSARLMREVARVLRPGGRLLLRSTFGDRIPPKLWHGYFPGALAVERELFPTLADTVAVFGAAGFSRLALDVVTERYATSLAGYAERLKLRGISVFEYLTEAEIEAGFAALDADVAAEAAAGRPQPVEEDLDLLVLGRR